MHRDVEITRWSGAGPAVTSDAVAIEEPLEIRVNDDPFVVTMRTPGCDPELAAGWLISEGLLSASSQLYDIIQCADPERPDVRNVVTVYLDPALLDGREQYGRQRYSTSACGLCGRAAIESALAAMRPRATAPRVDRLFVASLPARLRERQDTFERTGGLHAAGLFGANGECVAVREDVGRHNAVDKAIGAAFLSGRWPVEDSALVVSGRAGFEIVQKAASAGIGVVCSISAPSSLAVEVARALDMVLAGFVRDGTMNLYSGAQYVDCA